MKVNTVFSTKAKPHILNVFPKKMLNPIKNIEHLKDLIELASLQNQVKFVRLQDKLGKQNFDEDMEEVFEPVTKSGKDVSEEVTKTMTDNSI